MYPIRIGSQQFTASEWDAIVKIASKKKGYHAKLTRQNVLRLALNQPLRQRGGARLNTGNRKPR